jgi:dephospho-CoA kinase
VISHNLFEPGSEVYKKVVAHFGREVLNEDKTISRPKLANMAFPERIQELNAIVHPVVIGLQDEWMREIEQRESRAIAIVEAALMIEAGAHKRFDKLIVVTCGFDQKVDRFAERARMSTDEACADVRRRMEAQLPESEKIKLADYVIDNSGSVGRLEEQVERIWRELCAIEAAKKR